MLLRSRLIHTTIAKAEESRRSDLAHVSKSPELDCNRDNCFKEDCIVFPMLLLGYGDLSSLWS